MASEAGNSRNIIKPFMIAFIVLLLAAVSAAIYFTWNGTAGMDWAKNLPVISYFVDGEKTPDGEAPNPATEKREKKEQQKIAQLQRSLNQKDDEINQLKSQVAALKNDLKDQGNEPAANKQGNSFETVAKVYAEMAPENAASIMNRLKNDQAVQILSRLK
ncbi:MAG TPA: hypothetical protein VFK27_00200, partial [Bacillales bacterium]|nr:hypothetical protein [Bacillales bacterium]